jgi:hypothetical protein
LFDSSLLVLKNQEPVTRRQPVDAFQMLELPRSMWAGCAESVG